MIATKASMADVKRAPKLLPTRVHQLVGFGPRPINHLYKPLILYIYINQLNHAILQLHQSLSLLPVKSQEVRIAHVLLYSFCEVVGKTKSLADAWRQGVGSEGARQKSDKTPSWMAENLYKVGPPATIAFSWRT